MTTTTLTQTPWYLGGSTKRAVLEGLVIGVVLTGLSYLVGTLFGWITEVNYLEAFAVFTSYICTYLCVRERRIQYLFGAVSTAAYCVLFLQSGLLASALLNFYLPFALIYGWFRWKSDTDKRPVTRVAGRTIPLYVLITAASFGATYLVVTAFGGVLAPVDSAILIGTILAQWLMDNKKLENWAIWFLVNVAAIYVYFSAGLALVGFQYIFFLANAVFGFYVWYKSMKQSSTVEVVQES